MTTEAYFTLQSGARGTYWTDQPLGSGFFGMVYPGESPDGAPIAVKVIQKQRLSGAIGDRLLRREVDVGRRVRESGADMLLPVIDVAETSDTLLLVMTRADAVLADMAMPIETDVVIPVLIDLAAGLQQLHDIGILHRDLKPANVLRHQGRWKLADFGIARDQELGTQDATFVGWGSYQYMAPELWELKSPTVKTDLYALGCIAFELLAGRPLFSGLREEARARHLAAPSPEIPTANVALKNLITRLIAKKPGDRPQDARAVGERLVLTPRPLSPVQELLARELADRAVERSRIAAQENAYMEQVLQAREELRSVLHDAFEQIQAVDPDAKFTEKSPERNARERNASWMQIEPDYHFSISLDEGDSIQINVQERWKPGVDWHTGQAAIVDASISVWHPKSRVIFEIAAYLFYAETAGTWMWGVYGARSDPPGSADPEKPEQPQKHKPLNHLDSIFGLRTGTRLERIRDLDADVIVKMLTTGLSH